MRTLTENGTGKKNHLQKPDKIQTSLYELCETVIDVIGTDKHQLFMAVLLDTLRKGNANVVVSGTISN